MQLLQSAGSWWRRSANLLTVTLCLCGSRDLLAKAPACKIMSAIAVAQSMRSRSDGKSDSDRNGLRSGSQLTSGRASQKSRRLQRMLRRTSSVDLESGADESPQVEEQDCLSRAKRVQLLALKYTFVCMNMTSIAISAYVLFIANAAPNLWIPRNSLIILGLIFGMILSVIAIRGGMKEELYLVLTYSSVVAIVYVLCLVHMMLNDVYSATIATAYVAVCFYYSLLLYLKPPKAVLPDFIGDQIVLATKAAVLRKSESRKRDISHSSQSSVRATSLMAVPRPGPRMLHQLSSQSSPPQMTRRQSPVNKVRVRATAGAELTGEAGRSGNPVRTLSVTSRI